MQRNVYIAHSELLAVCVSSLVIAFIVSWKDWGVETPDVLMGVTSLIVSFAVALGLLLLRLAFQKRIGHKLGYYVTYMVHRYGLITSFFLAFLFNGFVPYVTAGELRFEASRRLRLGNLHWGPNFGDYTKIVVSGIMVLVFFTIPIELLLFFSDNFFIQKFLHVSAAIAFFSLIPIPGADGFHIFYHKRWLWVFITLFVALYFGLALLSGLFSFVVSLVFAGLGTFLYLKHVE